MLFNLHFFLFFPPSGSVSQLNRTFDLTYTLPTHRATVYLMGYLVGYWMQQRGRLNLSSVRVCGHTAVYSSPYTNDTTLAA